MVEHKFCLDPNLKKLMKERGFIFDNNNTYAAYAIGGKDAMIAIGEAYVDYINKKDKQ